MRHKLIRLLRNARLWQLALVSYWLALFVGTHVPVERVPKQAATHDKFAHIIAFGLLSAMFATTWELSAGRLNSRHLVRAWFVIALYGAFEEATQPMVGRYASFYDWLADAIGAAIGIIFFVWARRVMTADNESNC
jgi:VanZ family protein